MLVLLFVGNSVVHVGTFFLDVAVRSEVYQISV